jgi:hypothetical protein
MRFRRVIAALSAALSALVLTSGAAEADAIGVQGTIQSWNDLRCLDVYANGAGPWVQLWRCNNQPNQLFHLVYYTDTQNFEIRTIDHWCVDGRWGRGASLERSPCTGHPGQRWTRKRVDDAFLIFNAQYPNLVMDVYDAGRGTKVQLWDLNGWPNQMWKINILDTAVA